MVTRMVEHWAWPEKYEEAKAVFAYYDGIVRNAPGVIFRQVSESEKYPFKFISITTWQTQEQHDTWNAPDNPERVRLLEKTRGLWRRGHMELFEVVPELSEI